MTPGIPTWRQKDLSEDGSVSELVSERESVCVGRDSLMMHRVFGVGMLPLQPLPGIALTWRSNHLEGFTRSSLGGG